MSPSRHLLRPLVVSLTLFVLWLWPHPSRADLRVVTTVPTLASLAKDIGRAHVKVESLALPTQDPHFVDAKPSLALTLNQADLLLAVGIGLESGWLPTLQKGARNPAIQVGADGYLEVATQVALLEQSAVADRAEGDIHPGGNPHFLYDPRRVAVVAKAIAQRMAKLDPGNAAAYMNQYKDFLVRLEEARTNWEKRLSAYKGTKVVGYHKSWTYLTDWLGFSMVAFLEPKPGIPPNPAHVAKVLATMKSQRAKLVLQESYYPDATAKLVADKSAAKLVMLPGGASFAEGESFLGHIESIVRSLERALRP
jgi:zinc/manganese transport system substrate-binding protein